MTTQLHQTDTVSQARAASRIALLMLAAAAAYDLFVFFLAFQSGAWQLLIHAVQMAVFCAAMLISAGLSRRGRFGWGIGLQLASLWVTVLVISALFIGLGITMALIGLVLTLGIASQTLAQKSGGRVILAGVGVAMATLSLDFLGQGAFRLEVPTLQLGAAVCAGMLALVYAAFAARQFRNYSLRTKLITAFLAVVTLSVATVEFINQQIVRAELTQQAGQSLVSLADSKAGEIVDVLDKEIDLLRTLSLNKFVQDTVGAANVAGALSQAEIEARDQQWRAADDAANADSLVAQVLNNEMADELREFQAAFPEHAELFLTDRSGVNLAATNRTSDYYQADEAWWQAAYNNGRGGVYVGQPEFDESSQTFGLIIAVSVSTPDQGDVVGVLRTTLNQDVLIRPLLTARFGQTGHVHISLPNGEEIHLVSDPEAELKMAAARLNIDELVQSSAPYQSTRLVSGAEHLASQAPLSRLNEEDSDALTGLGWRIVAHQAIGESLAPVQIITRTTLFVTLGALLMTSVLALAIARVLSRPIIHLTKAVAKISAGDLAAQASVEADDEVGALAAAFNGMTAQLRESLGNLEQRVQERTRALTASAEVSRRLSTILDRSQLIAEVVEQVRSAFNYYYTQIYVFDEDQQTLTLAGGTGEVGKLLSAKGHKITEGKGLVGRAATTNEVVLAPDTSQDPNWLPNVILPDTKSEIAVPIQLGGRVLGVLDVQHSVKNGLTQADADLLQSIANQVAVALQNAGSFERARQQAERAALINTIGQKIQRANSVENVLQIAVGELGQALRVRRASVELSNPTRAENSREYDEALR